MRSLTKSFKNVNYVICREGPALSIYFGSYNELKKKIYRYILVVELRVVPLGYLHIL